MKTNFIRVFICTCLFLSMTGTLMAQSISGKVIDEETGDPIAFANVVLMNFSDSTYMSGQATDMNGHFLLNNYPAGNYLLQISFIGYQTQFVHIDSPSMGTIGLIPASTALAEVVVKGKAQIFKMENGGISANIRNTPLKNMGTLPEILGQMPFVLKDMNSYTVFGKGTPVFYINDRLVRDENEIQQISSQNVKKVTVITDPGAEYDASVNAVIKIETIRPQGEGFSGAIHSYGMYRTTWSNVDWATLNYRKGDLDIFGKAQFGNLSYPKYRKITNNIQTNNNQTTIQSNKDEDDGYKNLLFQAGFNYLLGAKHSIGARYENNNMFDTYGRSESDITVIQNQVVEESLLSQADISGKDNSHYVNAYYNGKISDKLTVKLDLDYKSTERETNSNIINFYDNTDGLIETFEESSSNLYAGKLTLNSSILTGNLTYGTEASHTNNKQDFYIRQDSGTPGLSPSNNEVNQDLIALFVSYYKSFEKFNVSVGGRYENIQFEYYQRGLLSTEQSKKYNRLFPNVNLSYKNDNVQMQLSYRNTTFRPGYYDLRSTITYQAPYSYYSGNPYLKPTYRNSLSYMLIWKDLTLMSTYTHYTDRIIYFPELYLENSILLKPVNVNESQNFTSSIGYAPTIKIWKPRLELIFMKDFIKLGDPEIKYNEPIYAVYFRNNFQYKGWQWGMDIYFASNGNRLAEYINHYWQVNVYLNKSFFNDKLLVNLNINDIFDTNRYKVNYISNNLNTYYNNNMYRQYISVSITYRFNAAKNRYKGNRASDEIDRL